MKDILTILKSITVLLFINFNLVFAQDAGTGGLLDDGGAWDGGSWDGGVTTGGLDDGGSFIGGCIDPCADNFNPQATYDDISCIYTNCDCLYASMNISQYPIYQCYLGVMSSDDTCEEMSSNGLDCSLVESCGLCPSCSDQDNDQICDDDDSCPLDANNDIDNDNVCGNLDNCPNTYNPNQFDADNNGEGNACTNDNDGDGVIDEQDCAPNNENISYDLGCGCGEDAPSGCDNNCGSSLEFDECGICGGDGASIQCWNDDIVCDLDDCEEEPIIFEIEMEMLYPLNEEQILDYENVNIRWDYVGTSTNDVYVTVNFAYNYGGGYQEVARNIPIDDGNISVDLSTNSDGVPLCDLDNTDCIETIHGKISVIASDGLPGNNSIAESEDLIIGEPEGDISINWLDRESEMLTVDWSWINDQSIVIQNNAFESLNQFSTLIINDNNGIYDNTCANSGNTSSIDLLTISLSDNMEAQTYKMDCGVDYCYESGQRIPGYVEGNQIYFYTLNSFGQRTEVFPIIQDNISPIFNNSSIVIEDFSLTDTGNGTGGNNDNSNDDSICYESIVDLDEFTLLGEYNNSYYFFFNQRERWDDAQHISQDNGGNLISINSQEENDIIVTLLQESLQNIQINSGSHTAWIGYHINNNDNYFEWVSGDSTNFSNWVTDEPNNLNEEQWVEMYLPLDSNESELWGKWNNHTNQRRHFILEIENCENTSNLDCYYYTNQDECTNNPECWWTNDCGNQMLCMPYGIESDCGRERDYDGFSIYNKITSIRNCNVILGCTDANAINYDEQANKLDCSCYYDHNDGCMDNAALNFNPSATVDTNNACLYGTCNVGCMDNTACNYDSSSIVDNGGCLYGNECFEGCIDDGNCTIATCGFDSPNPGTAACNFDGTLADGWINDGSCSYTVDDPTSDNDGWCPLETLTNVTLNVYNDRIPAMQSNSDIKYRVWLLDDLGNEVLKTFESSGISVTVCEEADCNGEFGGTAYTDDCGECISLENICDDCELIIGDIDGDGLVNVVDVVLLVNIVLSSSSLSAELACVADFNGDGSINVVDIVNLVTFVLG